MRTVIRALACLLVAASLAACSYQGAERYRYACSLSEADLVGYRDAFLVSFPGFSFEDFVNECDSGSAKGVVFRLADGAHVPTGEAMTRSGCVRFRETGAVDDDVYRCTGSHGRYELILEDSRAYLNPLAVSD